MEYAVDGIACQASSDVNFGRELVFPAQDQGAYLGGKVGARAGEGVDSGSARQPTLGTIRKLVPLIINVA